MQLELFIPWPRLWDMTLDHGARGTAGMQALYRNLTCPSVGSKPCHLCNIDHLGASYFEHFIVQHSFPSVSSDYIVHLLSYGDTDNIFLYVKYFLHPPT